MTNLTKNENAILAKLRAAHFDDEVDGFGLVYLDNAINTDSASTRGTLASLERKGFYRVEDGYAWGWVKTPDADEVEAIVRKHTAFDSFNDLVNAAGGYVPSIRVDAYPELRVLAEAYDRHQESRGDLRRAFVTYPRNEQDKRDAKKVAAWREERRLERERRIAAKELETIERAHSEALRMNEKFDLENPTTPAGLAKLVKARAKACIDDARRSDPRSYFVHRAVEVLALDENGRVGMGEPVFIEVRDLSGKALREAVETLNAWHGDAYSTVGIQGGVDAYDSFHEFAQGNADYEPTYNEFEAEVPRAFFD